MKVGYETNNLLESSSEVANLRSFSDYINILYICRETLLGCRDKSSSSY